MQCSDLAWQNSCQVWEDIEHESLQHFAFSYETTYLYSPDRLLIHTTARVAFDKT